MLCQQEEREAGRWYPRTCPTCRLGPCRKLGAKPLQSLSDAQAEIARLTAVAASEPPDACQQEDLVSEVSAEPEPVAYQVAMSDGRWGTIFHHPDKPLGAHRPLYAHPPTTMTVEEAWHPIETANKDAMSLLLYFPTKGRFGVKQGFYVKHDELWAWFGYSGKREAKANQPTHWMPLPAPPTLASKKQALHAS